METIANLLTTWMSSLPYVVDVGIGEASVAAVGALMAVLRSERVLEMMKRGEEK